MELLACFFRQKKIKNLRNRSRKYTPFCDDFMVLAMVKLLNDWTIPSPKIVGIICLFVLTAFIREL